jgi:restriction endonuclease S subunit
MKVLGEHPLRFEITKEEMFKYERMDVNFFRPEYVKADALLRESKYPLMKLGHISRLIKDGPHQAPELVEDGVIFLQKGDITEGEINLQRAKKVTYEFHEQNPKTQVYPKDLLLRKIGVGPREAAVVPDGAPPLHIYVSLAVIRLKEEYDPQYVEIFLNSWLGRAQTERRNKGTGTPDLHLEDINEIEVPIPPKKVQEEIIEIILKARKIKRENLSNIERYRSELLGFFLSALGLSYPESKSECFFVANVDERLDPHFYHPRFQKVIDNLGKGHYPLQSLGQILSFSDKHIDRKRESKRLFKYVQLQNVDSENHVITSYTPVTGIEAPGRAQMLIHEGDILIPTLGGSLESVAIVPKEYDGEVASNGFAVLSAKDEKLRNYAFYYLTTLFAQAQLEMLLRGTIMPSVNEEELRCVLIPMPNPKTMEILSRKIRDTMAESMRLREESEVTLRTAKEKVEKLILGK